MQAGATRPAFLFVAGGRLLETRAAFPHVLENGILSA